MIFLAMYKQVGNLNPYALDYPVCLEDSSRAALQRPGRTQRTWLLNFVLEGLLEHSVAQPSPSAPASYNASVAATATEGLTASADAIAQIRAVLGLEPVDGYEPCEEDYMTAYLAQPAVREAIHVKTDIDWTDCSRTLR